MVRFRLLPKTSVTNLYTIAIGIELLIIAWLAVRATIDAAYAWYPEYAVLFTLLAIAVIGAKKARLWGIISSFVAQGLMLELSMFALDDFLFYPENFTDSVKTASSIGISLFSIVLVAIVTMHSYRALRRFKERNIDQLK